MNDSSLTQEAPPAFSITFAGQSMIRGDVRADAPEAVPAIMSLVKGELAFTNFEAAVFDATKGETYRDGRFATPPEAMEALQSFGFELLSLANNHSFDLGVSGILNTLHTAERLGFAHAGTGRDIVEADGAFLIEASQGRVGFIALASGLIHDGRATDTQPGVNELRVVNGEPHVEDAERILARIREIREQADIVIVSQHNHLYPGVEQPADFMQLLLSELPARLAPAEWLEPWARRMVEAGADVVALHGPPFMHGIEIYRGRPIFYSLGSFIFQVPPESVHLEEPIMWESIVADVDFVNGEVKEIRLTPIAMNKLGTGLPNPHDQFDVNEFHRTRGLPRVANGAQAQHLFARLGEMSIPYGTELVVDGGHARIRFP